MLSSWPALPAEEADAIEDYLARLWEHMLQNPATSVDTLKAYTQAFARTRPRITPYLAAWTALFDRDVPLRHAAAFVSAHYFEYDAEGHSWPVAPFGELRKWLFSTTMKSALKSAAGGKANVFSEALEALEHASP